ncbi:MAG: TetR/AcrR family transcriptional regulator [Thermoleophilia bacterium]
MSVWEERRRTLVRAACLVVADVGVEGLTLDRVAQRAGVSKGAVQYAFGSRDELLGALARWVLQSIWMDGGGRAPDDRPSLDQLMDGLIRGLQTDSDRMTTMYALLIGAGRNPAVRQAFHDFYAEADPRLTAALEDAMGGHLDPAERATLIHGLRGMIVGMYLHWTVHPEGRSPDAVAAEIRAVFDRLLGAVTA